MELLIMSLVIPIIVFVFCTIIDYRRQNAHKNYLERTRKSRSKK